MSLFRGKDIAARTLFVVIVSWLALPGRAWSQPSSGISGTVRDGQQAVVVGATVTLVGPETDRTVSTTSDGDGRYVFSTVAPGAYCLIVEAKGFAIYTVDITAVPDRGTTRDVELTVAGASEIVNVTASGFVDRTEDETATQTTLRRSALTLLGTAAQSNIYKTLDLL